MGKTVGMASQGDYSEEFRAACEVRSIVKMFREKGSQAVKAHLLDVQKHRGKDAMEKLRQAALDKMKEK